jgi:hypothetical protein
VYKPTEIWEETAGFHDSLLLSSKKKKARKLLVGNNYPKCCKVSDPHEPGFVYLEELSCPFATSIVQTRKPPTL